MPSVSRFIANRPEVPVWAHRFIHSNHWPFHFCAFTLPLTTLDNPVVTVPVKFAALRCKSKRLPVGALLAVHHEP